VVVAERSFKVLVVEDEPEVAHFIKKLLEKKFSVQVETTPDLSSARVLMEGGGFDVVTLDYQLPDGDGISLLEEIATSSAQPPVIVITGHGDEKTAVRAFKSGAAGYVVKDARLHALLPDAFEKVLSGMRLDEVSMELADSAYQLALVLDNVPMIIARVNDQRRYIYANRRFAEAFGTTREELVGKHLSEVIGAEAYQRALPNIDRVLAGRALSFKAQLPTADGPRDFNLSLVPRLVDGDAVKDYFIFGQDAAATVIGGITPAG
jgi:PAS domain S-box-containing protein